MPITARPKWHYLYYILAVFDVLTVLLSLYLSLQLMRIYRQSVAVNQLWAQRLTAYAHLGQLAMAVNAPGNNIFGSYDVAGETARMHAALQTFTDHLTSQQQDLRTNDAGANTQTLQEKLTVANEVMKEMTTAAEQIFSAFRTQQAERAGPSMAMMDQKYATLTTVLAELQALVSDIQTAHFQEQATIAARLQRYEYAIAGCILLMVGGATAYGRKLAVKSAEEEVTRQQNEAALQLAHQQLEQRITERTADLVQTNLALQQEIIERTRMEQRLAELSHKLLSTQENERRHLARELHDELGQNLTALRLGLEMLEASATSATEPLRECTALVDALLQRVRSLSLDLRPAMLDDLGLAAALEWYVPRQAQLVGGNVHLDAEPLTSRPDPMIETVCFRVVQEALTNVVRHAQAHNVWITLRQTEETISLSIRDDGIGFIANAAEKRAIQGASIGVLSMRERVALVEGDFDIISEPHQGTQIHIRVPFNRLPKNHNTTFTEKG